MKELKDIDRTIDALNRAARTIPDKAGTLAVNFSKKRFVEQNWIDHATQTWKRRKERGRKRSARAVLTRTGRLRRSIRKGKVTDEYVIIETDVPYARIHNEGFRGTVNVKVHKRSKYKNRKEGTGVYSVRSRKERTRTVRDTTNTHWVQSHKRRVNMPKRQYLGSSAVMNKQIQRMMTAVYIKALKR